MRLTKIQAGATGENADRQGIMNYRFFDDHLYGYRIGYLLSSTVANCTASIRYDKLC